MKEADQHRCVWFAPGDHGHHPVRNADDVKLIMENCSWLGIRKIFPLARINHSQCTSPIMKRCPSLRFVETIGPVDLLEEMTKQAPPYGIEIHPWVMCNYADRDGGGSYPQAWLIRDAEGRPTLEGGIAQFACPNNEAFLEQSLRIVREILTQYEVQGLHLDFIRYPINITCRCAVCQKKFVEQCGEVQDEGYRDIAWNFFCCDAITREVKSYHGLTQSLKKQLSAAVFVGSFNAENIVKQDWSVFSVFLDDFYIMAYGTPITILPWFCADILRQSRSKHPGVGLGLNDGRAEDAKARDWVFKALSIVRRHGLGLALWNYEWFFASRLPDSQGLSAQTLQEIFRIIEQ